MKSVVVLGLFVFSLLVAVAAEARRPMTGLPKRLYEKQRLTMIVQQKTVVASCEIVEILATKKATATGIDKRLARFKAVLSSSQFTAYNSFDLEGDQTVTAPQNKVTPAHLVNNETFTIVFKNKILAQGAKPRLRMGITVDDGTGNRIVDMTLTADEGSIQIPYAGAKHKTGVLIVALTCTAP